MNCENTQITLPAYAKLNLYLDITGKRPDGYHTLNTVMTRIDLHDTVDIRIKAGGAGSSCEILCDLSEVHADSPEIPTDERNIAYKAYQAFVNETGKKAHVQIVLHKRIPCEAGLGGSSTDGAAVLEGLNRLYGFPVSRERLMEIGTSLGADVPFCLLGNANGTVNGSANGTAKCTGIGEICQSLPNPDCHFLIVKPEFACSTKEAYQKYDLKPVESRTDFSDFVKMLQEGNLSGICNGLYNIFEILYNDQRITDIKKALIFFGAKGACMTGSGSGVFGVFASREKAEQAKYSLESAPHDYCQGLDIFLSKSCPN